MGLSPKKPKAPKAPTMQQPLGIQSGAGNITYNPQQGYAISTPFDQSNLGVAQNSIAGYNNFAGDFWKNPGAYSEEYRNQLRAGVYPAFDNYYDNAIADSIAGLGNRYRSTFGALTGAATASNLARQRAGLDLDIYKAGEDAFDQRINQLGQLGNIATLDQGRLTNNYGALLQALQLAEATRTNSNNFANQVFNTQSGMYQAQLRQPTFFDRALQAAQVISPQGYFKP